MRQSPAKHATLPAAQMAALALGAAALGVLAIGADGSFHGLQTPRYDFNDEILPDGMAYRVNVVHQELGPARQEQPWSFEWP